MLQGYFPRMLLVIRMDAKKLLKGCGCNMSEIRATTRDAGVDVFRALLMLSICVLHSVQQSPVPCGKLSNVLLCAVDGFVMISGWFGIRFSWRKLLLLYVQAAYASVVVVLVALWRGCLDDASTLGIIGYGLRLIAGCWFLNAYAVLMILAPLVDRVIEDGKIGYCVPLLIMVFGWGYLTNCQYMISWLPADPVFSQYSGMTLLGVYVAARLLKKFGSKLPMWRFLVTATLACIAVVFGLGNHNSVFTVLLAWAAFVMFGRLYARFPHGGGIGKLAMFLQPSLFVVYVMHTNDCGFGLMQELHSWLSTHSVHFALAWVVVGSVAFVVTIVLDMPRRLVKFASSIRRSF